MEQNLNITIEENSAEKLKRTAVILLLGVANDKHQKRKDKIRLFYTWKERVQEAQNFVVKLELSRLHNEVASVKYQEQLLKTNFNI